MPSNPEAVGVELTTLIDAPLETVFAYYGDPTNLPEIWPSMIEVSDVEHDPDDGHAVRFRWVYKMAGMRFHGRSEVRDYQANRRYVSESAGGIESTFDTNYRTVGGKTEVHEIVRYRVPVPLLGRLAEGILRRMNENELGVMHANLKAKMEAE